jgi:hypothetical protein
MSSNSIPGWLSVKDVVFMLGGLSLVWMSPSFALIRPHDPVDIRIETKLKYPKSFIDQGILRYFSCFLLNSLYK